MKTRILAWFLCLALILPCGAALAAEWPLFPEGVGWDSTLEEVCAFHGMDVYDTNVRYAGGYTMARAKDRVDFPGAGEGSLLMTYVFADGKMIATGCLCEGFSDFVSAQTQAQSLLGAACPDAAPMDATEFADAVTRAIGPEALPTNPADTPVLATGDGLAYYVQRQNENDLFVACFQLSRVADPPTADDAARGFDTPGACARAVADALAALDADAFLACFAIPEAARNADAFGYARKVGAFTPENFLRAPVNGMNIAANEANLTDSVMKLMLMGSYMLTKPSPEDAAKAMILLKDVADADVTALLQTTELLGNLRWKGEANPADLIPSYAEKSANAGWRYTLYGFETWKETVALLDYEGETVYMPLGLVRLDGRWLAAPMVTIAAAMMNQTRSLLVTEDMLM